MDRLNDCLEGSCVLRVAIVKEIAAVLKGAASLHGDVPSHLRHPLLDRVGGDPGDLHLWLSTRMSLTTHGRYLLINRAFPVADR